jgi:hypothetical protein
MLAELFREPMNQAAPPTDDVVAAWDRERTMVIDAYNRIIDAGAYAVRELRIAHEIAFYAKYSPSAIVRDGCQELLARLAPNPDRNRYRALISEFVRADTFIDARREHEWNLGDERRAFFITSVAAEMIASFAEVPALIADLRARSSVVDAAGLYASSRELLAEIVSQRPDLRQPFLDALLGAAEPSLLLWVAPLIRATFIEDPEAGEGLARRILEIEHRDAGIAVANSLIYRTERADGDCAMRTRLLATLLGLPSPEIRHAAAHNLMFFKNACPAAIPQLVLDADIGLDAKLADRLFMALPNDLAGIDDGMRGALAEKLVRVQELEYWSLQFLARMASTQSALVIDVLSQRIFLRDAPEKFKSAPFSEHEIRPLVRCLTESPTFEAELRAAIHLRADAEDDELSEFARFLGHVAHVAPDMVKGMIDEALRSERDALQRAALSWVESLPHTVIEGDVAFIVNVLECAHAISDAMGERAEGKISVALFTGAESVGHYEGAPSDMRTQNVSRAALAFDHLSVPVRRFFDGLLEHGRRSEEAMVLNAKEVFGPQ